MDSLPHGRRVVIPAIVGWTLLSLLLAWGTARVSGQSWSTSTIAGRPPGSTDGVGAKARFCQPNGVAADAAGNIYVADTLNNTIRKISPSGTVSTLAGTPGQPGRDDGTGSEARFCWPTQLAVTRAGTIYVVDTGILRAVTPGGVVTTVGGFSGVAGAAADAAGTVYVSESGNHIIKALSPSGSVTVVAGVAGEAGWRDGPAATAHFNAPTSLAVDGSGNVYVVDSGYGYLQIRKIDAGGSVTAVWTCIVDDPYSYLRGNQGGIAVDIVGNVYFGRQTIQRITPAGLVTVVAGAATVGPRDRDGPASVATLGGVMGMAFDSSGNLWLADAVNSTMRKLSPAGVVTTEAGAASPGSVDGEFFAARFNGPTGIAVDTRGSVYVCDTGNFTVRIISTSGIVTTMAGAAGQRGWVDGTGADARFLQLTGIAVDPNSEVAYVMDAGAIRSISPEGVVSQLAGSGDQGAVDGPGDTVGFNNPMGFTVGRDGCVYVADTYNHAIRRVAPNGFVTTVAGRASVPGAADGSGADARFNTPVAIAADGAGNLYVDDAGNAVIRLITPDGMVCTVGPDDKFLVTDFRIDGVCWVDSIAAIAKKSPTVAGPDGDSTFISPVGLAVGPDGDYYIVDQDANAVRRVHNGAAPQIIYPPQPTAVQAGAAATLGVAACGDAPLIYQWFFNGQAIAGANDSLLKFTATPASAAGSYTVSVTNYR